MLGALLGGHSGLGYLLAILSTISVLVAVAGNLSPSAALRGAGKGLRSAEGALVGIVGLLGIAMWVSMGLPMGLWPAHVGLVAMVASSLVLARVSKPALIQLSAGDTSAARRWLAGEALNWVIVVGTVVAMHSN